MRTIRTVCVSSWVIGVLACEAASAQCPTTPDINYYGAASCTPPPSCILPFSTPGPIGNTQCLNVRLPGGTPIAPTILYVHGGAWAGGHKDSDTAFLNQLCSYGYSVVSCNYTLACDDPSTPLFDAPSFPDAVQDVRAAIGWIRSTTGGQTYSLSPCIVLVGNSAGGNLAAMAGALGSATTPSQLWPSTYPTMPPADLSVALTITFSADFDLYRRGCATSSCICVNSDEPHLAAFGNDAITERYVGETWGVMSATYTPLTCPIGVWDYTPAGGLSPGAWTQDVFLNASPTHWLHAASSPFYMLHSKCDQYFPTAEPSWMIDAGAQYSLSMTQVISAGSHGLRMYGQVQSAKIVHDVIQHWNGWVHCQ